MSANTAVWVVLALAILAANLPWLSNRIFFVLEPKSGTKSPWFRLLEWLVLYFLVGGITLGLEQKIAGGVVDKSEGGARSLEPAAATPK